MLHTRSIPIYEDDMPADWHAFLSKAAKGSIKAVDILTYAHMAYMVALTGDSASSATMHLDDYHTILRHRFPIVSPASSIHQLYELALASGWIAVPFRVSEVPCNDPARYVGLWGRSPVAEPVLMNDAMIHCVDNWSPDHFIDSVRHHGVDYDARLMTTAMLYLSLTWPEI